MSNPDNPKCRADLMELAKRLRRKLDTLYTLGNPNDPWMADVGYRSKPAHWIAKLFREMNLPRRVHVRQVHYKLVSQETPVPRADGSDYVNSTDCFNHLCDAIRDARYLGLIPLDAIIDRRNPEPTINQVVDGGDSAAVVDVSDGEIERYEFGPDYEPPEITFPETSLSRPKIGQRYHLEIWIEKSTANDILLPLGREYGINVVTFIGEVSATACKSLVDRAIASGKPVRILHVTDFDPAGRDMPISAAVKIDFFARQSDQDLDIRLEHVALSEEHCVQYRLPRTPIKATEGRAAGFEARYGAGGTELDALEALHPGVLRQILTEHIERYYDANLATEVRAAVSSFTEELADVEAAVEERFSEEIADVNDQRDWIAAAFAAVKNPAQAAYDGAIQPARDALVLAMQEAQRVYDEALAAVQPEIEDMQERLLVRAEGLIARMKADLVAEIPEFDWPEAAEGDEDDDPLYASTRGYVEQVDVFRHHRGDDDEDIGLAADRIIAKTCKLCGLAFTTNNRKRAFCSDSCRDKSSLETKKRQRDASASLAE